MSQEAVHVGIDVSKLYLDVSLFDTGLARVKNDDRGIDLLIRRFKRCSGQITVYCEATGGYESPLCKALLAEGIRIARLNAARVREFARSQGVLAKTDRTDAQVLSDYGRLNHPRMLTAYEQWQEKALALMNRREELIMMRRQEQARLDPSPFREIAQLLKQHLRSIDKQLERVEKSLTEMLAEHAELAYKFERLTAVQAIGRVSALSLIVHMPELGTISGNQAAALAGLAPYNRDSGTHKGRRMIRGGRPKIRKALYMSAVVASYRNPVFKELYERLRSQGKPAKVALTAVMRKMVVLANRLLADPDFQPSC